MSPILGVTKGGNQSLGGAPGMGADPDRNLTKHRARAREVPHQCRAQEVKGALVWLCV